MLPLKVGWIGTIGGFATKWLIRGVVGLKKSGRLVDSPISNFFWGEMKCLPTV